MEASLITGITFADDHAEDAGAPVDHPESSIGLDPLPPAHTEKSLETDEPSASPPWQPEHVKILVDWCDKAMSYRWLHRRCHRYYTNYNAWFTIPVIVMSTLTGTANFATEYFPDEARTYVPLAIGTVNILAGIIGTVHQFLKVSEINEAHRASHIAWDKFYRNLKLELCKRPKERLRVNDMLRYSKEEYDRLIETSPMINDHVIREFKRTFHTSTFAFPEVCDNLIETDRIIYTPATDGDTPPSEAFSC